MWALFRLTQSSARLRQTEKTELRGLPCIIQQTYGDGSLNGEKFRQQVLRYARVDRQIEPHKLRGRLTQATLPWVQQEGKRLAAEFFPEHPEAQPLTENFVALVRTAHRQKDLSPQLTANQVIALVYENLAVLAYQTHISDRALLSDHGLIHVQHNLVVGQQLFDALDDERAARGLPKIKAIDRLLFQQATILHDAARAADVIVEADRQGSSARAGHPLYMAKLLRERFEQEAENPKDALVNIFRAPYQRNILHEAIRTHDWPMSRFDFGGFTEARRAQNILTVTRVADGTHVFQSKLPALLRRPYAIPALYALKRADALGAPELAEDVKSAIRDRLKRDATLSSATRDALEEAIESLNATSYVELISRIFGDDPALSVQPDGRLSLTFLQGTLYEHLQNAFDLPLNAEPERMIRELGSGWHAAEPKASRPQSSPLVVDWKDASGAMSFEKALESELTRTQFFEFVEEASEMATAPVAEQQAHLKHWIQTFREA